MLPYTVTMLLSVPNDLFWPFNGNTFGPGLGSTIPLGAFIWGGLTQE